MAQSLTYRLVLIFPFRIEAISINEPMVGLDVFMRLFDHNRIIFQVFLHYLMRTTLRRLLAALGMTWGVTTFFIQFCFFLLVLFIYT